MLKLEPLKPAMKAIEGSFEGVNGSNLRYKFWVLEESDPRAVLVIVHGSGEHIDRYENLVDILVPEGYVLMGFDLRGHGRSEGQRGHINSWDEYRGDLKHFIELTGRLHPGLPVFLYGHSMGSLIALEYLIFEQQDITGSIISGIPLVPKKAAPPHLVLLVKLLSRFIPKFSIKVDLEGKDLSRDAQTAAAYMEDPLVHWDRSFSWGAESLKVINRIKDRISEIKLPILFLHGACDEIVSSEGAKFCYEHVQSEDRVLKIYDACLHEPHNDLDYKIVVEDIKLWMDAHSQHTIKRAA